MKLILTAIFLLLFITTTHAQKPSKLDSLKNVLAHLPAEGKSFAGDTLRVWVLCEMGEAMINEDKCIPILREAYRLASKISWTKGEATSINFYARRSKKQGNLFRADSLAYIALKTAEEIKDYKQIGFAYRNIADVSSGIKKFNEAKVFYNKAIFNYAKINDKMGIITCYNNLGVNYFNIGQYEESYKTHLNTLKLNQKFKIEFFNGLLNNNISVCLDLLGRHDEALIYAENAINIYKKLGTDYNDDLATTYSALSSIYYNKKDVNKAIYYANLSIDVDKKSYYVNANTSDLVLYKAYKELKQFKTALFYYEKLTNRKDSTNLVKFEQQMSANNYHYQNEKLKLNEREQSKRLLYLLVGLILFSLFIILLFYNQRVLKKKNKLIKEQNSEIEVLNKNLEIKVEERTKELQEANQELIIKNEAITKALVEGQTIERKRVASELHDNLGSMLSSIKWRFDTINKDSLSDKEKVLFNNLNTMLSSAYSEVRLISHNMLPYELEQKGLIGALEKFVLDINESEKIKINFYNHNVANISVPKIELELYSVCMEIINNILKHAKATEIEILFKQKGDSLFIFLEDNGIGIDKNKKNGKGLLNIENRIKSLNGTIELRTSKETGTQYKIEVKTSNQTTATNLH
jgi:signal transduction histidine kinase